MPEDKNNKNHYLSYGIGFGLLGGAFIAVLLDAPLVWAFAPGFGMLAGIIIGIIMDSNKKKE